MSASNAFALRPLGKTGIEVSPVAMGCWPIAGMTTLGVTEADSLATLQAAVDAGINFFDTAYCYGADGESERLIAKALGRRRREIVIATKSGIHWDAAGARVLDARPATLRQECETSLRRLNTAYLDLLYLHAPDPNTPVADSAGALLKLQQEGNGLPPGRVSAAVQPLATAD
jgi:aryl-alcohol dehydrogenase-like predicted oxidoreductase